MKYTIDRQTWRRGGDSAESNENYGATKLLNEQGYMCCLGQCMLQEGILKEVILEKGDPAATNLPCTFTVESSISSFSNNVLSQCAMDINDDRTLDDSEREEKLINLFKEHGLELEFVN